jgi:hypothetical protein
MDLKNKITIVSQGKRADIGRYKIDRLLPNRYTQAIGPFVFLDHLLPTKHTKDSLLKKAEGTGPHPHRGIATLTYVLNGEAEHYDSKGHHAKVHSGGVQWMKAGNGIIHDESMAIDPLAKELITHSFQFWINLPARNKAEEAAYLPLQANEIPLKELANGSGWLKIIAGEYKELSSKIPSYTKQFIYHLHLEGGYLFSLETSRQMEYAAFLPMQEAVVNDTDYQAGDLLVFEINDGAIEVKNISTLPLDVILFGGEPYIESIVAGGPFVMNTQHEISLAYNDYYQGKYGEIMYNKK